MERECADLHVLKLPLIRNVLCEQAGRDQKWFWVWVVRSLLFRCIELRDSFLDAEDWGITVWGRSGGESSAFDSRAEILSKHQNMWVQSFERSGLERMEKVKTRNKNALVLGYLVEEEEAERDWEGICSETMESQNLRENCFIKKRAVSIVEWCGWGSNREQTGKLSSELHVIYWWS